MVNGKCTVEVVCVGHFRNIEQVVTGLESYCPKASLKLMCG